MIQSGNPFDARSPGVHVTDDGRRYLSHPGEFKHVEFLLGQVREVYRRAYAVRYPDSPPEAMFPNILIELNIKLGAMLSDGTPVDGDQVLADALAFRGLQRVQRDDIPPEVDKIEWAVRLKANRKGHSGVLGPGPRGERFGWMAAEPMPDMPQGWTSLVRTRGQVGIFVTTKTEKLSMVDGLKFHELLALSAATGDLWATRAAVLY